MKFWRHPRKSGLTPKTTKARIVHYTIIQSPQWYSELTHSFSVASIYLFFIYLQRLQQYQPIED